MSKKVKRIYNSTQKYQPYDATHGFKVQTERFDNGQTFYTVSCNDCENTFTVNLLPDKNYPMLEINGVLLGMDTAQKLFEDIFHELKK